MFERVRNWWSRKKARDDAELQARLEAVRRHNPVPVFWLFGRTQSGKTSIIKYLTGAGDAEIGHGFKPCTRFSRHYEFPNAEAPLLRFLDTRGVDEPGYDPAEDIAGFGNAAHLVVVTVKALDHAQENVLRHLRTVRESRPTRPVLLLLTSLHEAYAQQQHVEPYPFGGRPASEPIDLPDAPPQLKDLLRSLEEQRGRFAELVDYVIPVDLTKPEEGFAQPNYGGEALQEVCLRLLPEAQRHTLEVLETGIHDVKDLHSRRALPTILGYSVLAGSAGAIPLPFVSLLILPGIQRHMVRKLAELYGRPLNAEQFAGIAERFGLGSYRKQARHELLKLVPSVGVVAAAASAGSATYALGQAYCHYDATLAHGGMPDAEELRRYYDEQLETAKKTWKSIRE
jgi:uncharacterized protein (DUF697 family)